jgi:hypothetical protein
MAAAFVGDLYRIDGRGFQVSLPSREFWEDPKAGTGAWPAQWVH